MAEKMIKKSFSSEEERNGFLKALERTTAVVVWGIISYDNKGYGNPQGGPFEISYFVREPLTKKEIL